MTIEERNKLIEQYHDLIWSFMNQNRLYENDIPDFYGACAVGLVKAADTFNESLGFTFTTYAYACIENAVAREFQYKARKMEIPEYAKVCIDKPIVDVYGIEEDTTIADFLVDTTVEVEECVNTSNIRKVWHSMTKRERDIINMRLQGYTFKEIGEKYSITKQRVEQLFSRFKNKLKRARAI